MNPELSTPPSPMPHDCVKCGRTFLAVPLVFGSMAIYAKRYCDACIEAVELARAQERDRQEQQRLNEAWERICPPLFRDTDDRRLPCDREIIQRVLGWPYGSRGLLLHGETSTGKTRLVYHLLWRLHHHERRKIAALSGTAFSHQVGALFGEGGGRGEAFIERLTQVDVLFIDDVGKGRLTERVEAEFFHVIDERSRQLRPTLLTTNLNGEALATTWSSDRAEPLVRRLREFFDPVAVLPKATP